MISPTYKPNPSQANERARSLVQDLDSVLKGTIYLLTLKWVAVNSVLNPMPLAIHPVLPLKCSDLHEHPLVANESIFLQGKASSMVVVALNPKQGWEVCAILLDPSCFGSGTVVVKLDHLLLSHAKGTASG
ncbi:putative 28S rRNA (cytosine-C(5))-methyltransferase isoform X3 [Cucumis melo var. makuwa]|uniref:28S rRNA (Cytosine-C(5))-methyltransferase isoform X3 n=1 Tax=Cucumis melo var. makuwa TaxID=1194695 RepID=A0A5A7SV30_CUCMM|nr:putative 28S rRNA (cytosine-C(5))-methyltransferase isoform X3 [Cucumis melo var. makuwa]TYK03431.1 putative 28S rRNA (cytosine-C(5))-methyltransferase isoform X3 [Cucumis melo var. makuwa]